MSEYVGKIRFFYSGEKFYYKNLSEFQEAIEHYIKRVGLNSIHFVGFTPAARSMISKILVEEYRYCPDALLPCPVCGNKPKLCRACGEYFLDHGCSSPLCDHISLLDTVEDWNRWVRRG